MRALSMVLFLAPFAAHAWAGTACPPSAQQSLAPPGIALVGHAGAPDPAGNFTYVVRDVVGNPVPGSTVVLDFSQCPDARLASDVLAPGTYLDCARRTIRGVTNQAGEVTFRIVGSGLGGSAAGTTPCLAAHLDGIMMPALRVSVFDLDGVSGVGGADLQIWGSDFASGRNPSRSDYDFDGRVGASDLFLWGKVFSAGGSTSSGLASCGP